MVLADGKERNVEALTTTVNLNVEGKIVRVKFIALPESKGNRTLLGTDFFISLYQPFVYYNTFQASHKPGKTPICEEYGFFLFLEIGWTNWYKESVLDVKIKMGEFGEGFQYEIKPEMFSHQVPNGMRGGKNIQHDAT
ncbi:unnamed protein product [Larinioides sclopetarius]|uniref:Uncharacterized protein n=1 Tax=Larinioides sclopetarius TaxID=280406 RepID=A0AAV2AGF1_9ARAC